MVSTITDNDIKSIFAAMKTVDYYENDYVLHEFIVPKLKRSFFNSQEWRDLRWEILKRDNWTCQFCGVKENVKEIDGEYFASNYHSLQVDHIEPITKNWYRRLDPDNLQVLCKKCNLAKSNSYPAGWNK